MKEYLKHRMNWLFTALNCFSLIYVSYRGYESSAGEEARVGGEVKETAKEQADAQSNL
jgi:hypothetical protein